MPPAPLKGESGEDLVCDTLRASLFEGKECAALYITLAWLKQWKELILAAAAGIDMDIDEDEVVSDAHRHRPRS